MEKHMDEQEQIRVTQKYLEKKRRRLAARERIGSLTEANLPWDERTPTEWERRKEQLRKEVKDRERNRYRKT